MVGLSAGSQGLIGQHQQSWEQRAQGWGSRMATGQHRGASSSLCVGPGGLQGSCNLRNPTLIPSLMHCPCSSALGCGVVQPTTFPWRCLVSGQPRAQAVCILSGLCF